ncbi:hypothetical protein D3C84_1082720 [compost metagenome]
MAHDDMIQYLSAYHVEGILEGFSQCAIGLAGFWIARGVVVNQDHGCRVVLQSDLDHLPWINAGAIQRASE